MAVAAALVATLGALPFDSYRVRRLLGSRVAALWAAGMLKARAAH